MNPKDLTREQLQALRDKVFRDAMGLEVDSALGKDSGASQLSTLVHAFTKLTDLELKLEAQNPSGAEASKKLDLSYLPNF